MEVFLNRAFDKLKKDGRAKQYAAVRDACDKARDALRDDGSRDLADGYVAPLVLACKTRRSALMVTALDCFQKLVAHGYLRGVARHTLDENGNATDPSASTASNNAPPPAAAGSASAVTVMDRAVDTICRCKDSPADDVQLR